MGRTTQCTSRGRRATTVTIVALAVLLAGCHTTLGGSALLTVTSDRTVAVELRCGHATESCTGTAVVRIDGLHNDPLAFAIPAATTETVVVTLTEGQYALVPTAGYVRAEVRLDTTGPTRAGSGTVELGLRRPGPLTRRASVAADGTQPVGASSSGARTISADGRFVAFRSLATNLVPGDTNGAAEVFVHDRVSGQTSRVSVASDGVQANREASSPAISADGRHVMFFSYASNLVDADTNAASDVFVRDLSG